MSVGPEDQLLAAKCSVNDDSDRMGQIFLSNPNTLESFLAPQFLKAAFYIQRKVLVCLFVGS